MENPAVSLALDELEDVYSYLLARVGNRADAEDLTQQVAVKALPRLHSGAAAPAIRSYLYATARSVLGGFWSTRLRLPQSELDDDLADPGQSDTLQPSARARELLERTLSALPPHYREVLELRFLQGASIREVAVQTRRSLGAVKVMQLRALRAAAALSTPPTQHRPARRQPAAARGSAYASPRATPAVAAPRR